MRSDTDDADGQITPSSTVAPPDLEKLRSHLSDFVGSIEQTPPAYSAARIEGRRAYDLARKGQNVALAPRTVQVYGIDILRFDYPELELEVHCGKGTYIRSIARDLGERLGCGAYVSQLRRTQVGPFLAEHGRALRPAKRIEAHDLLPLHLALSDLPRLTLKAPELTSLKHGQYLEMPPISEEITNESEFAIFNEEGAVQLIARLDRQTNQLHGETVLHR